MSEVYAHTRTHTDTHTIFSFFIVAFTRSLTLPCGLLTRARSLLPLQSLSTHENELIFTLIYIFYFLNERIERITTEKFKIVCVFSCIACGKHWMEIEPAVRFFLQFLQFYLSFCWITCDKWYQNDSKMKSWPKRNCTKSYRKTQKIKMKNKKLCLSMVLLAQETTCCVVCNETHSMTKRSCLNERRLRCC